MTLDDVEAMLWRQTSNLANPDPVIRGTAMEAVRVIIQGYAEDTAGSIIAGRREKVAAR